MGLALEEAAAAVGHGDVPVGAVALVDGRVIASRHNEREQRGDPTAHAELLALSDAAAVLGTLAAVRGDPGGDPGAVPDVRRGAGRRPGGPPGLRGGRPEGRARAARSTTCAPTPGSTTRCRSPPASGAEESAQLSGFFEARRVERRPDPGWTTGLPQPS